MTDTKEKENTLLPLVVIFGRTNVGKSTLFNCLVEKRQALVSDIAGTTRDSNLGRVVWLGQEFELVDTGGIIDLKHLLGQTKAESDIDDKVQEQAKRYLKAADLVIFLADNKTGLLPADRQMALLIKKSVNPKKIILAVNKVDSPKDRLNFSEFYELSFGDPRPISAASGSGTGDLLDIIVERLRPVKREIEIENCKLKIENFIKVCIIGQPNVGKSSLLNSLLGYERVIVSSIPHTTREPQHTDIIYQNQPIKLIDTAGISRRGTKTKGLEKFGIVKSLAALAKSDIALLVMDISQPLTHQDAKLVEEIVDAKKSFIFIANKWDKIAERDTKKYADYIYGKLPFAKFAPIQFISAETGEKVKKIFDLILQIGEQRKLELSDSQLQHFLSRVVKIHRPAKGRGVRHPRIREFTQVGGNPPIFELKIGVKEDLHFSYVRFLENRLRETYGFLGTPLTVKIAKNKNVHGLHRN